MQNELQQLLSDLDDGRLDEAGRRRLDELCAADPALARRLRQEERLAGLLARCGPNHAPSDLVYNVLSRLDSHTPYRLHTPWYGWLFRPAIGAALAFTAMAVIGVQVGLKIHGWRGGTGTAERVNVAIHAGAIDTERQVASAPPAATRKKAPAAAPARASKVTVKGRSAQPLPRPARTESAAPAAMPPASMVPQVTSEFPQNPAPGLEEFPAPETRIAAVPAQVPPAPTPGGITGGVRDTAPPVNPLNPNVPRTAAAAARPTPALRPAINPAVLADRTVAMEIFLTPVPQPASAAAAPAERPEPIPNARSFVPPSAAPKPQALTLKDVEINLYAVGAEDVSTHPIIGRKNAWEVQASLTPEQFRNFTAQLRGSGIIPGESVLKASASSKGGAASSIDRTRIPSAVTNRYEIRRGSQWMQPLERLDAATTASQAKTPKPMPPRLSIRITVEQQAN